MKTLLLALVSAFVLILSPTKAAAQADVCQADIDALTTLTETTVFAGDKGAFFQTKLLFHLSKATAELAQGDVGGALRQMKNYNSNLKGAIDQQLVSAVDGAALQAGSDVVVACLKALPKH